MDHVHNLVKINLIDHEALDCEFDAFDGIRADKLLIMGPHPFETVLDALTARLASHLQWAATIGKEQSVSKIMRVLNYLHDIEEARIGMQCSNVLTKALLSRFYQSKTLADIPLIILLLNWNFKRNDISLLDRFVEVFYIKCTSIDSSMVNALSFTFLEQPKLLKRFLENPQASSLVSQLVLKLESLSDTVSILQVSSLLLQMTKDKYLLEEENASSILKLATAVIESAESREHVEAACIFLSVACSKPMLSTRLRRILMAGLLRKLFAMNSTNMISCTIILLTQVFDQKLLTEEFIPQHNIPDQLLLRWINGHPMEIVRAVRLIKALIGAGLLTEKAVNDAICEELQEVFRKCVHSETFGALNKSLGINVPAEIINILRSVGNFDPTRILLKVPPVSSYSLTWTMFPELDCNTFSESEIFELLLGAYSIGIVRQDPCLRFGPAYSSAIRLLESQRLVKEKQTLEELHVIGKYLPSTTSDEMLDVEETQIQVKEHQNDALPEENKFLRDENENLTSKLKILTVDLGLANSRCLEYENQVLSLQLRLSSESAQTQHYRKKLRLLREDILRVRKEMAVVSEEVAQSAQRSEYLCEFLNELVAEMHSLKSYAVKLELKLGTTLTHIADLEEQLTMTNEERKMIEAQLEQSRTQLQSTHETFQSDLASARQHMYDLEARVNAAQQQHHACREELLAVQLSEGQLKLELHSCKSLMIMRDEQLASCKAQVDELTSRRI